MTLDERLTRPVPSQRQLSLQQLEFYAFVHFTVNTFTGKEWGDGTESPAIFDPQKLDADQWAAAVKSAGMKGIILTCKHHDGFCLWPSRYTDHTVAASPYKNGRGDVVRETAEACRRAGLKFGVYLSPWDRHDPRYGSGDEYNEYYVNQLTELLTEYGEIFAVWLDGACGEGPNGKRQVYDWERYYETVRKYQPGATIHVCGPDIRWCGNEAGEVRPAEWSVVPARTRETESHKNSVPLPGQRKILAADRDLGSREILQNEQDLVWYPAEVNTSIRPGWFYHAEEDDKVKTPEELFEVYLNSVGGNATFLLNIPPTPEGLFHRTDVLHLQKLGRLIKDAFAENLLEEAALAADSELPGHGVEALRSDSLESWFQPEGPACEVEITFPEEREVGYLKLKEAVTRSQRMERFTLWDERGQCLYTGSAVGYQKIVRLPRPVRVKKLVLRVEDSREYPTLTFLGVYGS